jgi:hypothetical protein
MSEAGTQTAPTVAISYTEHPNGNIDINIDPHKKCQRGQTVTFELAPNCDATDFLVTFKPGRNPFGPNSNPNEGKVNRNYPQTGPCTALDGDYDYTVALTTKHNTTVTVDPVIIVQGP